MAKIQSLTSMLHAGVSIDSDGDEVLQCPTLPRWEISGSIPIPNKTRVVDALIIILNTLATVAITFLNKIVLDDSQFANCQVSFAMFHFAVTFLILYVATRRTFRVFKPVRVPVVQILPISLFFIGFLLSNNCSLAYNSIGFYQLAKILTTPAVVAISYLLLRKTISQKKLYTVLAMCVGVAMTVTSDVTSNPLGAILAAVAFLVTACYQIWIGKKLEELQISPAQLLLNQTPTAVILLAFLAPFVDTAPNLAIVSPRVLTALVASGLVASLINLSQFMIIGRTSALTFNIVSMLKMVSILSLGWYVEGKSPSPREVSGVGIAFVGAFMYSRL